jgi:hypothetical protein
MSPLLLCLGFGRQVDTASGAPAAFFGITSHTKIPPLIPCKIVSGTYNLQSPELGNVPNQFAQIPNDRR